MCILRYNNVETESGSSTPEDAVAPDLDWSRSFFQRPDGEVKHLFNENELMRALCLLDKETMNSKNLRKVLPLRVIAINGYVSLTSLGNCPTISQITYILDPHVSPRWKIEEKLKRSIEAIADYLGYDKSWMSSYSGRMSERLRQALWKESLDQNVVIWAGQNLTVYAPLWEWMLDEKMKALAGAAPYVDKQDLTDAVDVVSKLNQKYKRVISADLLAHRHRRIQPPVRMAMYYNLNQWYEEKYHKPGLTFKEQ